MCFRFEVESETFHMKILKPELKDMTIRSYIQHENEIEHEELFRTKQRWIAEIKSNRNLNIERELIAVENLIKILDM